MIIEIDGKRLDLDLSNFSNLEELIYDVMEKHVDGNKLITEVKINDVTFSERWPGEAKVIPLDKIYKIEFITKPLHVIADKFLEDLPNKIDGIIEGLKEAAELYRVADEQEANLNFVKVINALREFINFIAQLKRVDIIEWDKLNLEEDYEKLINLMDEMVDVQEDEDWILLADLIEYELSPLMESWKNIASEMRKHIKNA